MPKTGLLLCNLGTPDSTKVSDVRRYLRQFLSDDRVLDMNRLGRWLLLNLIILPLRPAKSAHAYQKIWTPRGSPLLFHGQDLTAAVARRLPDVSVKLAMRYGNPSTAHALAEMEKEGVERVVVFPLYPQYAASSSGSALEEVMRELGKHWNVWPIHVVEPFYAHPAFVHAFAQVIQGTLHGFAADHLLFSFHGLPERHVEQSDPTAAHCLKSAGCCDAPCAANRACYRHHSFETARALGTALGMGPERWSVSFQSRLGRIPWIKPYTDEVLPTLAKRGVKKLAVACPAFVADCLETLEEIGMRAKEEFCAAGGEDLVLVPSLNVHPTWVDAVLQLASESSPWLQPAKALPVVGDRPTASV